ncbi:lysozyme [Roseobacter sp. N2S]|uniref:lysozyme n=1 Tax=Roseobacter sp. N2S TaxID=2663844 RepID=UPI00285553F0|nr:lysozyme [Roseobacter sp. N2S]MDR6266531.1 GH24 family phage-related lysozyme (muramidase) [Roseobacter sp. N2S]
MRLIPNAKRIAIRSHSMWANYLGILCLVAPELIFWLFERDTNPRIWWIAGVTLIAYGIFGRLKDQGIGDKLHSPFSVTIAAFLLAAFPIVSQWEGKENRAYLDRIASPPVWTVCYGETRGVKQGDYYSDAQCRVMLERGLIEYRNGLHLYFTDETITHRLTAERDAAYVSLAWNVGMRGAGKSTATRRLNAGNISGGCTALTWWNRAGGRVVRGLARRRQAEYDLCMIGAA